MSTCTHIDNISVQRHESLSHDRSIGSLSGLKVYVPSMFSSTNMTEAQDNRRSILKQIRRRISIQALKSNYDISWMFMWEHVVCYLFCFGLYFCFGHFFPKITMWRQIWSSVIQSVLIILVSVSKATVCYAWSYGHLKLNVKSVLESIRLLVNPISGHFVLMNLNDLMSAQAYMQKKIFLNVFIM